MLLTSFVMYAKLIFRFCTCTKFTQQKVVCDRCWHCECISLDSSNAPITEFHTFNITHDRFVTCPFCFYFHSHAIGFPESWKKCKSDRQSRFEMICPKIYCRHLSTLQRINNFCITIVWSIYLLRFFFRYFLQSYLSRRSFVLKTDRVRIRLLQFVYVLFDRSRSAVFLCSFVWISCPYIFHSLISAYMNEHSQNKWRVFFRTLTNIKLFDIFHTPIAMIIIKCISSSSKLLFFRWVLCSIPNVRLQGNVKNRSLNNEGMKKWFHIEVHISLESVEVNRSFLQSKSSQRTSKIVSDTYIARSRTIESTVTQRICEQFLPR